MSLKELIQAELEFLSEEELRELYYLVKSRSQKHKNHPDHEDDLGELLERCKVHTGIPDLSEQHDHYLYGTPKKRIE